MDGDGVCDEAEIEGCTDTEACNFSNCATEEDGSCLYLDALGFCGGECPSDLDQDGVCDNVDQCTDLTACNFDDPDNLNCIDPDSCGECDGIGPIFQCGCANIPEGECDCDGNQLDALGICGGTCEADANGNGICDSVEQGLCGVGSVWSPDLGQCIGLGGSCVYDTDGNGLIGSADLIVFLTFFNLPCSE